MAAYLQRKNIILLAILLFLTFSNVVALENLKEYPFTDLPNHLAEATVYKFSGDSAASLTKFFRCEIKPWKPNIGHLVLYSLFPTVEGGNAVCYSLYMISVPLLTAVLIWLCRGDLWISILSCVTLYNFNTCWGFLGFTLSIPLALLCLVTHIVFSVRNSVAAGVFLSLLLSILFYMHVLAFLFVVLCFLTTELCEWWLSGKHYSWTRLIVIIPGAALFFVWQFYGDEFAGRTDLRYLIGYYSSEYSATMHIRWLNVFLYCNHVWLQYGFYRWLGALFSLAIIGWVVCLRRGEVGESRGTSKARRATVCLTAVAVFCYALLPSKLVGCDYIVTHGRTPFRFFSEGPLCILVKESNGWALFGIKGRAKAGTE